MPRSLLRRAVAEFLGTALLVAAVVGSGIMAERLAGGNVALALLCNTIATGAALVALILTFGPISGAHFNPAVSFSDAIAGGLSPRATLAYIAAQCAGGLAGTAAAHLMFSLPLYSLSTHARSGGAQMFSEFMAAFGLMSVIWGVARARANAVPFAVGAYITAAYWFTASTSFANPAVTIARAVSNTFAGIRPADAPAFIVAQFAGALAATALFRWLLRDELRAEAPGVLVPHPSHRQVELAAASGRETSNEKREAEMKTFLFACVHNAGRSQMAAAFFNLYAAPGCRAISAGTAPAARVHPEVVAVMKEVGLDLSAVQPQKLTEALARSANVLVTMGCGDHCPFAPGLRIIDWSLPDPKGQPPAVVRQIRDQIHEQVKALLRSDCAECCASELTSVR